MTNARSLVNETDGIDVANLANVECKMAEKGGQTVYYVDGVTLSKTFPAATAYGPSGVRQVDQDQLLAVLVEAVKALQVAVTDLDGRVTDIEEA